MLPKDIYILLELLGNDPKAESIRFALSRGAISGETALQMLQSYAPNKGIDPNHLPAFGFIDKIDAGELSIGRLKVGDNLHEHIGIADKGNIPGHILIAGQSKRGKTVLSMHLAAQAIERSDIVLVLARDHEWRELLQMFPPDKLLFMEPDDLGINAIGVPNKRNGKPAMSPVEWVMMEKVIFRSSVFLRDVASNILSNTLLKLYKDNDVENGGDYPCLSDLRKEISWLNLGSGKRLGEARDTLLNRLDMLIQFLSGLDVVRSRDIHKLFSYSIILDVTSLEEIPYMFLFNFMAVLMKAAFPQEDWE